MRALDVCAVPPARASGSCCATSWYGCRVSDGAPEVARVRETIGDCAALREKVAPELRAALAPAR
jgi:hypothetical protein